MNEGIRWNIKLYSTDIPKKRGKKYHFKPKSLSVKFIMSQGSSLNAHQACRSMRKMSINMASTRPFLWRFLEEYGFVETVSAAWLGIAWCTTGFLGWWMSWVRGAILSDKLFWEGNHRGLGLITLVCFRSPVLVHYRATRVEKLEKFAILLFLSLHFMSAQGGKFSLFPFLLLSLGCPSDLCELIIF